MKFALVYIALLTAIALVIIAAIVLEGPGDAQLFIDQGGSSL